MADTVGDVLRRPVIDYFMPVHVNGEVEGEVEPRFYEDFRTELGNTWHLYDSNGFQLSVEFNSDDDVPRIQTGWMTIRGHYNFENHHPIIFRYLGNNQFEIIPNNNPITPDQFATWHTNTRSLRKVVTFEITITEDPEVVPELTLPDDMGEYIWNTMLDQIWIIGDVREKHKCDLEFTQYPFEVKITSGWPEVGQRLLESMDSKSEITYVSTQATYMLTTCFILGRFNLIRVMKVDLI